MSNITKTFKHYQGYPYKLGVRSFGKYDDFIDSNESSLTIDRDTLTDYDGLNVETLPYISGNETVIDLSKTKLPWKYDFKDKLLTSSFALIPYDETVTQQIYEKGIDYGAIVGNIKDETSVFNTSNYIIVNKSIDFTQHWEGYFVITTPASLNNEQDFIGTKVDQRGIRLGVINSKFMFLAGNGSWFNVSNYQGSYTVLPNTQYYIKFGWNGSNYYLKYSLNGTDFIEDVSYDGSSPVIYDTNSFYIGCHMGTEGSWNSLINLDYCYINDNIGIKIWEGKFTYIPKYKTNYTLNGSPNISYNQIASGFSERVFIIIGNLKLAGKTNVKMYCDFTTGTMNTTQWLYTENGIDYHSIFGISSDNRLTFGVTLSHTNSLGITCPTVLEANTHYTAYVTFDGTKYQIYLNDVLDGELETTQTFLDWQWNIGSSNTRNDYNCCPFRGSVDLSKCYISVDDEIVWKGAELDIGTLQGCVKAYYGEGANVTTPPQNINGEYQVFAINGDERVALYSSSYTKDGKIVNRLIQSDNVDENFWYLGNATINTVEDKTEKGLEDV